MAYAGNNTTTHHEEIRRSAGERKAYCLRTWPAAGPRFTGGGGLRLRFAGEDEPRPPQPPTQTPDAPVKEPPVSPGDEPNAPVREPGPDGPKKWGDRP